MPASDVAVLTRPTSASWEDRPFEIVAWDECVQTFNRIIRQALHRITPGCIKQLAPIEENLTIAVDEVEYRFDKPRMLERHEQRVGLCHGLRCVSRFPLAK